MAKDKELSNEDLRAKIAELEAANKEQASIIDDQTKKLDELSEMKTVNHPTVKVGDDIYEIVIQKFIIDGSEKTAEDVKKDKTLAEQLLKMQSGVLVKKEKGGKNA